MSNVKASHLKKYAEFTAIPHGFNCKHGFTYQNKRNLYPDTPHQITASSWTGFIWRKVFKTKKEASAFLTELFEKEYSNPTYRQQNSNVPAVAL